MSEIRNGLKATLDTFYGIISGRRSEVRDWERMRVLFFPGARLFPNAVTTRPTESQGLDIDHYIQNLQRFLGANDFFERGEITECFVEANIAAVVSAYEARLAPEDVEPTRQGINYVHFLHDGEDWKITSMIWRDN